MTRVTEKATAVMSFAAAVAFAFTALMLSEQHSVTASNCSVIAQFLLLTATLFGVDYHIERLLKRDERQEPKPRV